MKRHIFQQLEALIDKDISDFPADAALPDYRIPTSLALSLDSLLHKAVPKINAVPAVVLAEVLEAGIVSWISMQSEQAQRTLGITPNVPSMRRGLTPVPTHADDDFGDADDPDPASAQRAADAYMSGTLGYTSMTLHTIAGNGKQNNGANGGRKKSVQQNTTHGGHNKHGGQNGSSNQNSKHRRRRPAGPRPN